MNDDTGNIFVLHGRKKGTKQPASHLALRRALQANAYTIGMFAMNTFARRPMLMKPIPRPNLPLDGDFKPRPLADYDITAMIEHFDATGFNKLSPGMVRDVVMLDAQGNAYSPPADRIRAVIWDGTPRLDQFFIDYAGVEIEGETDEERVRFHAYVEAVTRCFFISVVARVMKPGCKVDNMLVLEGKQGARKSSLLRVLALDDEWFSDSMPHDLADKDARQHLPGNLIVELAEIAQLKRSEIETVKAFLTCQHDKYRPSFGRFDVDWPRQNIFVGTTNSDDYLQDATGNRRFWPLKTTMIHVAEAAVVIEQIYAEAFAAYEAGEKWWLEAEIEETASSAQASRMEHDPWYDPVATMVADTIPDFEGWRSVGIADILEKLVPENKHQRAHEMRIASILMQLGGERARRGSRGKRTWKYWFKPT